MGEKLTVVLPDIGEGVVEGEIVEWLKKVGDPLKQDEPVVVVMTDKATVELPAPCPGKLAKQYYAPGETAFKDRPLYDIEVEGTVDVEVADVGKEKVGRKEAGRAGKGKVPSVKKGGDRSKGSGAKAMAAPPVRRLAKEMGIDLSQISGTGKEGRVIAKDLIQAVSAPSVLHLEDDEAVPLVGVKRAMAKKMAESKRVIPHFSYFEKVDAGRLLKLHDHVKREGEKEGISATFMPYFIRALSLTIREFPELNSSLDNQTLLLHKAHNIGIAMSTGQGLIVPVLKGVEKMTFSEVVRAYARLKGKASFDPEQMREGTITISNFGVFGPGGVWATPIINPPEAVILAVNRIQSQPIAKDGRVEVASLLDLSWSFDHRIIDGSLAAAASRRFAKLIENPALLL